MTPRTIEVLPTCETGCGCPVCRPCCAEETCERHLSRREREQRERAEGAANERAERLS